MKKIKNKDMKYSEDKVDEKFKSRDGSDSIRVSGMPTYLEDLFKSNIIHDKFKIVFTDNPFGRGEMRSLIDLNNGEVIISSHRALETSKLVCACILDWFGKHEIAHLFRVSEAYEMSESFKDRLKQTGYRY